MMSSPTKKKFRIKEVGSVEEVEEDEEEDGEYMVVEIGCGNGSFSKGIIERLSDCYENPGSIVMISDMYESDGEKDEFFKKYVKKKVGKEWDLSEPNFRFPETVQFAYFVRPFFERNSNIITSELVKLFCQKCVDAKINFIGLALVTYTDEKYKRSNKYCHNDIYDFKGSHDFLLNNGYSLLEYCKFSVEEQKFLGYKPQESKGLKRTTFRPLGFYVYWRVMRLGTEITDSSEIKWVREKGKKERDCFHFNLSYGSEGVYELFIRMWRRLERKHKHEFFECPVCDQSLCKEMKFADSCSECEGEICWDCFDLERERCMKCIEEIEWEKTYGMK